MEYRICKDKIEIFDNSEFVIEHILECGQIFSYIKTDDGWWVLSWDKRAKVVVKDGKVQILTDSPQYFEEFFDLKTNYTAIKSQLAKADILKEPIKFGKGIRILKQNLFETLISFVVSANNNIKRIQMILFKMREQLGTNMGDFYAFPTREQLLAVDEDFFRKIGAGYRAPYLFRVIRQVDEKTLQAWRTLPTNQLRQKLISLAGVGPKVADCVLLFGFGRGDVFPVDTWIEKMYHKFYANSNGLSREQIRENLTNEFGELSGYAQQYLFYFMRSGKPV